MASMPQVEGFTMTLGVSTLKKKIQTMVQWSWRFTQSPKRNALCKLSPAGAIWIETGTFKGDTTARLSEVCDVIHTIEPAAAFHAKAARRFQRQPNVICHLGTSEALFEEVMDWARAHRLSFSVQQDMFVFARNLLPQ